METHTDSDVAESASVNMPANPIGPDNVDPSDATQDGRERADASQPKYGSKHVHNPEIKRKNQGNGQRTTREPTKRFLSQRWFQAVVEAGKVPDIEARPGLSRSRRHTRSAKWILAMTYCLRVELFSVQDVANIRLRRSRWTRRVCRTPIGRYQMHRQYSES